MQSKSDAQLLRDYAEQGSEAGFTEIVSRHANLVYSAALRQVDSPDLAGEVSQQAFIALARGARSLLPRLSADASVAGWLCRTARNLSLNLRRDEFRRHTRERQAMEQLNTISDTAQDWERLCPVLDAAMAELPDIDYDAIVLRFFKNQDLRSVGLALGLSDDTAQKRVGRALDKLRAHLQRRGVGTTTAALAVALSANAVQGAPAALLAAISTAAAIAGTGTASTTTTVTATKLIAMTTLQKALATTAVLAALATPIIVQHRTNNKLLSDNEALRQQIGLQAKQSDDRLAQARVDQAELDRLRDEHAELLRLRGEISRQRAQLEQLASAASKPAAAARTTAAPASTERDLPRDAWSDAGFATPEAALQTRGWAVVHGNRERFSESVVITPAARKLVEDMLVQMASSSTDPDKDRLIRDAINNKWGVEEAMLMPMMALDRDKTFTGYHILSQQSPSADEMVLEVETRMASAPPEKETLKFQRVGNDWKVLVDEAAVKAAR